MFAVSQQLFYAEHTDVYLSDSTTCSYSICLTSFPIISWNVDCWLPNFRYIFSSPSKFRSSIETKVGHTSPRNICGTPNSSILQKITFLSSASSSVLNVGDFFQTFCHFTKYSDQKVKSSWSILSTVFSGYADDIMHLVYIINSIPVRYSVLLVVYTNILYIVHTDIIVYLQLEPICFIQSRVNQASPSPLMNHLVRSMSSKFTDSSNEFDDRLQHLSWWKK